MQNSRFGALEATVIERNLEPQTPPSKTVVLLHGYGAPGTDLVGLASQIPTKLPLRFVFLQAPHALAGMSGPYAGRAWWEIDMFQLQMIMMTQNYDLLAESHPEGLDEATAALDDAVGDVLKRYSIESSSLYVGGFSQGAMLSCHWALMQTLPLAGLIQLSGTVLCRSEWRSRLTLHAALRVFQSHSPQDQVLPFRLAEELREMFKTAGLLHQWVSFAGGHGIGPQVMRDLGQFLS